jgi:hypothetical protein
VYYYQKKRDIRLTYQKLYYQENKQEIIQYTKNHYMNNKEILKQNGKRNTRIKMEEIHGRTTTYK